MSASTKPCTIWPSNSWPCGTETAPRSPTSTEVGEPASCLPPASPPSGTAAHHFVSNSLGGSKLPQNPCLFCQPFFRHLHASQCENSPCGPIKWIYGARHDPNALCISFRPGGFPAGIRGRHLETSSGWVSLILTAFSRTAVQALSKQPYATRLPQSQRLSNPTGRCRRDPSGSKDII